MTILTGTLLVISKLIFITCVWGVYYWLMDGKPKHDGKRYTLYFGWGMNVVNGIIIALLCSLALIIIFYSKTVNPINVTAVALLLSLVVYIVYEIGFVKISYDRDSLYISDPLSGERVFDWSTLIRAGSFFEISGLKKEPDPYTQFLFLKFENCKWVGIPSGRKGFEDLVLTASRRQQTPVWQYW